MVTLVRYVAQCSRSLDGGISSSGSSIHGHCKPRNKLYRSHHSPSSENTTNKVPSCLRPAIWPGGRDDDNFTCQILPLANPLPVITDNAVEVDTQETRNSISRPRCRSVGTLELENSSTVFAWKPEKRRLKAPIGPRRLTALLSPHGIADLGIEPLDLVEIGVKC